MEIFENEHESESFVINSDSLADWAIQKIAEKQAEYERLVMLGEENIRKIEERIESLNKKFQSETSFLKHKLSQYFETVPHKKTKTMEKYSLFSGELVLKFGKNEFIKNDDVLVNYFKENNFTDYIKTEEKPVWGEFKKRLEVKDGIVIDTKTGEVIDCVTVETKPDEFIVKVR